MGEMDDIVKEFLIESNENLDQLDRDLVNLEKEPASSEILSSIFRTIHTIKGTSGFLAFEKLEALTHVGESLLSRLRDGQLLINAEITSALLTLVDAVRQMLTSIEATGMDGDKKYESLIACLNQLQSTEAFGQPVDISEPDRVEQAQEAHPNESKEILPIGEILINEEKADPCDIELALMQQQEGDPRHVGEILVDHGVVTPGNVLEALQEQNKVQELTASNSNIRVDVGLLDKLMNLVGELVLARNQILQFSATQQDSAFLNTTGRLNLITTELQEGVMKTRMQPIGNIWSKFPRIVRDLATACGKRVRIEMEGKETDLDKTIIEAIKDPLTHLVRNVVDHGIETPEERVSCAKPAEGRLFLRAFHEGGQVNIEVSDDGQGIDIEKVKQKGLERGVITADHATRMNDREIINLIFLPGFSTAERITNVSGRGVGMDVVKTNIEKIGGTVDIQSKPGQGTTFKIKIPLTLAIIPALIVTSVGDRYAIPQVSLLELVRLEGDQARKGIEMIHGAPVYRLRGNLLPLAYLNRELGFEAAAGTGESNETVNIVVLQADDRPFGLVVDEINDTEEIVVKPLGKQLKGVGIFAGATIMGDGQVALILDVLGIAQHAGVVSEVRDRAMTEKEAEAREKADNRQTLLVFQVGEKGRVAIPLCMVARLEEFPLTLKEETGQQEVVQYRGQIMPLLQLSRILDQHAKAQFSDPMQVVVYSEKGRYVGLVVDNILDIVEEQVSLQRCTERKGILGSAVIQQRVTDLLDVDGIIHMTNLTPAEPASVAAGRV
jgi:two-component system, chemotaxis family, sensor kinase CheA